MLGVKKGTVRLEEYSPLWEKEAKRIISLIKSIMGDTAIAIEWVGSTSIKAIYAKPIIDIAVAVENLDSVLPFIDCFEKYSIIYRGEIIVGERFFTIDNNGLRTHHIHIVEYDGKRWSDYIAFRDYMISHEDEALKYESLKKRLAETFKNDRSSYTKAKECYITSVLKKAERQKRGT